MLFLGYRVYHSDYRFLKHTPGDDRWNMKEAADVKVCHFEDVPVIVTSIWDAVGSDVM
jgi:hypothetical protein